MRTVFIIFGSYGHTKENWFPWLKDELEKQDCKVYIPDFPIHSNTDNNHQLGEWLAEFDKYKKFVNKDSIIVAHSRGCTFAFHLLPYLGIKIDSLYLVGPFVDYFRWRPKVYYTFDTFQSKPFLWVRIKELAKHIEVYQSTNDIIPVSEGTLVADNLGAKLNVIKNAGHFNVANDKKFVKFPLLLEHIKERL